MKKHTQALFLSTSIVLSLVIAGHAASNKKTNPTYKGTFAASAKAGIRLLEDIFKRVHNEPQLAMARNNEGYKDQESSSSLDLSLAIKPKESGRLNSSSAPELKLLPSQLASSALSDKFDQNGVKNLNQIPIASAPKPSSIESWKGAARQEGIAEESSANSPGAIGNIVTKKSGFWEKDSQIAYQSKGRVPANAYPTQNVPNLTTSANNLYQVAKKLDELQKMQAPSAAPAPPSGGAGSGSSGIPSRMRAHALAKNTSGRQQTAPSEPIRNDFAAPGEQERSIASDGKRKKEEVLALLPPNVVTGIPLISLGVSEAQASTSLSELGHMTHERLSTWSIWSWQKNTNFPQTALQLYMKHGTLEAMRIFDSSLIAPNFGVNLGDDISKVKEKFGEPAFIIGEPESGGGQNYIYPISQIGFQLVRTNPNDTPKVISVLIFNVK